jgi:hypothetical protein
MCGPLWSIAGSQTTSNGSELPVPQTSDKEKRYTSTTLLVSNLLHYFGLMPKHTPQNLTICNFKYLGKDLSAPHGLQLSSLDTLQQPQQ